ncbi:MAG: putative metal-binding motif-containing protein [Myxococcota bacterium]
MIVLVALPAFAEGLPWECPAITVPADADVYRGTDAGLEDAWEPLHDLASAWVDEGCAWVGTTTADADTTTTERVCATAASTVTETTSVFAYSGPPEIDTTTVTLVVEVPYGETWTRLEVTHADTEASGTGSTYGASRVRAASWTGAIDGLPDDAWFSMSRGSSTSMGTTTRDWAVETPACAFTYTESAGPDEGSETVRAPDHVVYVRTGFDIRCATSYAWATIDDVRVGAVDRETWALDPLDADGDGWPLGDCDCDDTDATVSVEGWDVANDGVDQDCSGGDRVDWDLDDDGHDALAFGGDDCDDGDAAAWPEAEEIAGDGVDQDCDGTDDLDADGDGYTADGDARAPDCDDTDPEVRPGHFEIECDGVEQNCDGADVCDDTGDTAEEPPSEEPPADSDTEDTAADDDDAEPPEDDGCGGGAAWLGLLPLLGLRRRAPTGR